MIIIQLQDVTEKQDFDRYCYTDFYRIYMVIMIQFSQLPIPWLIFFGYNLFKCDIFVGDF